MRYPGGKGQAGIYQRLINLIPRHEVYIEPFVGGGNVLERKRPAPASIVIDADADIAAHWKGVAAAGSIPELIALHGDAVDFLKGYRWTGREFVYCDPPYLATKTRPRYRVQFVEPDHARLLAVLHRLPCPVMLSGYRSELYDAALVGWRRVDFPAWTRGHIWATESVWMNYDPPAVLHDSRYVGESFRDRERIKRMQRRWCSKLAKLPPSVRAAMLERLLELASPAVAVRTIATSVSPAVAMLPGAGPIAGPGAARSARACIAGNDGEDRIAGTGDAAGSIVGSGSEISSPGVPMVDVRASALSCASSVSRNGIPEGQG